MFTRRFWVGVAVVGAFLLIVGAGCGPKPPCPVGPEVVQKAQHDTQEVESDLATATAEREKLESELADKQAKLEALKGKPEELRKKLEALKKGSGR
jgi:hypothetical protein